MDLQNFTLFDDIFGTAEILTSAGVIKVEAEIMPGCPVHIYSIIWLETGADASMEMSKNLNDVRDMIEKTAAKFTDAA